MYDDTLFVAPNGKPTNLEPMHWMVVRMPIFILDENGEPLVVQYYVPVTFTVFNIVPLPMHSCAGVYFSKDPIRQVGDVVMRLFLNVRNPIVNSSEVNKPGSLNHQDVAMRSVPNVFDTFPEYDGIITSSGIIVKSPYQIKSADENIGNFDPTCIYIIIDHD
jgi:hypothetical protein